MWSVMDATIRAPKFRRTEDKGSWAKSSCYICGVRITEKQRSGEKGRHKVEE